MEQVVLCPHCENSDIYGHGIYRGRKRYKSKNCGKTFNDLTGTAISGIKKVDKFNEYLQLTIESHTIRKASELLGLNVKTIFDWRHKLLSSLFMVNGQVFSGIVECNDNSWMSARKVDETWEGMLTKGLATGKRKEV